MTASISYLEPVLDELQKQWPGNKTINIVCHGHSVPAGYFATPYVNTFAAYPHLLHRIIKERFPFSVVNVIVTAIGGENSEKGAERFDTEVLNHTPSVVTIDYALNDRSIGLPRARAAWEKMIEKALTKNIKVILLTPSWEKNYFANNGDWLNLKEHAQQVRDLASQYEVGLADTFLRYQELIKDSENAVTLLSHVNHPSKFGHEIIANEISKYFLAR
jgi:hypothetical protein